VFTWTRTTEEQHTVFPLGDLVRIAQDSVPIAAVLAHLGHAGAPRSWVVYKLLLSMGVRVDASASLGVVIAALPIGHAVAKTYVESRAAFSIQQNLPTRDELVQEVKVPDVTCQHGRSKLASLQKEESVIQEFPLVALILWQFAQAEC
jgi:hypothetical protein